jgi:hypothetical protein
VRALAVTAGGESGHPDSPHFNDEAARYASGDLREVYFYPSQLAGHTRRTTTRPMTRIADQRDWIRFRDAKGTWRDASTGYNVGQEELAQVMHE